MPNSYVIDIRHYLGDDGELARMPGAAAALALYFGSIVAWISHSNGEGDELTNVICRRSRARPPCREEVYAHILDDDRIEWFCPACRERGVVSGWRGTRWDRSA